MNDTKRGTVRFSLGQTMSTPGALAAIPADEMLEALGRHARGDWGECDPEDAAENDFSVTRLLRIFSVYRTRSGVKFWIITEADRSVTTVLLPEEY